MDDIQRAFREKDARGLARLALYQGGKKAKTVEVSEQLFTFDSGTPISLPEAAHHVLILGGTGRGKTSGLVIPMLWRLVEQGLGGLVLDVKNTFGDTVRRIAAGCGRDADVVEIGSLPSAAPVNLLAGMPHDQLSLQIESMLLTGLEHTGNADWLHKGVRLTVDCARLLLFLDEILPGKGYSPSLAHLSRILDDFGYARSLWKAFLGVADRTRSDHREFLQKVESDHFHILRLHPPEKMSTRGQLDYDQQVTWQISNARKSLQPFKDPSLARLSAGEEFDLGHLVLDERKIVLLRFPPVAGGPGKTLARMIKERLYTSIFSRPERAHGGIPPLFTVLDEFQDFLSLDESSSCDDLGWFSRSREFQVVNIVATQGLSSLYRQGLEHRVNALISQFATKIVLQNDDPATDAWLRNFFEAPKPAQKLGAGEVIVVKFALPSRCQMVGLESFQDEHDRSQARLAELPEPTIPLPECKNLITPEPGTEQGGTGIGNPQVTALSLAETGEKDPQTDTARPVDNPSWARSQELREFWETGAFAEHSRVLLPKGRLSAPHRRFLKQAVGMALQDEAKITLLDLSGGLRIKTAPHSSALAELAAELCCECCKPQPELPRKGPCVHCRTRAGILPPSAPEFIELIEGHPIDDKIYRVEQTRGWVPDMLEIAKRVRTLAPRAEFRLHVGLGLTLKPQSVPNRRLKQASEIMAEQFGRLEKKCACCGGPRSSSASVYCEMCQRLDNIEGFKK